MFRCRRVEYRIHARCLLLAAVCLVPLPAIGQINTGSKAADTSSPRATLQSFINGCNETHKLILSEKYLDASNPDHVRTVERIIDCIDDREVPGFARTQRVTEIAICIKEILDREELPAWDQIPDEAALAAANTLASQMLAYGYSKTEVKELIGWCSDEMALRYQHLTHDRKGIMINSIF